MLPLLKSLFNRTLNSVAFGIGVMLLTAIYCAVGSGRPWLQSLGLDKVPVLGGMFDLSDPEFFNAWPLKVLMILLCVNLAVVTWVRIPFTPPRYGVWCIHTGIITLIIGMAYYYANKTEGLTRVGVGQTVSHYYDAFERSLYVRVGGVMTLLHQLPSLPRFQAYGEDFGNASRLNRSDLRDIEPTFVTYDPHSGRRQARTVSQMLGLPYPLKLDIVGYWPYANVQVDFANDPSAPRQPGIVLRTHEPHDDHDDHEGHDHAHGDQETWLIADDPAWSTATVGTAEVEARANDAADEAFYRSILEKLHQLHINVAGQDLSLSVEPGKTYPLKDTGYEITVEAFDPNWTMFGTNERVAALTLMVKSPTQTFRRMVLNGKDTQTDFKLGEPGAGPMGQRQQQPLDMSLRIHYTMNDPYGLLPTRFQERIVIVAGKDKSVIVTRTNVRAASTLQVWPSGSGEIELLVAIAPFADAAHPPRRVVIKGERKDHIVRMERVQVVPEKQRDATLGRAGVYQVLKVRATCGDWQREVYVPYLQDIFERSDWTGPLLEIPGSNMPAPLQLQLGHTRLPLPARITLKEFELVPYAGGTKSASSMMRDFKSHLIIEDPETGKAIEGVAHMNNPVYYPPGLAGKNWLFYQAQWDPNGQQWTVLGVGNRPGVWIMTTGCAMMFFGLIYAFYVKPIILRKMKERALREHAEKQSLAGVS